MLTRGIGIENVRPSVRPSRSRIVLKWHNISSYFLENMLVFSLLNNFAKFQQGHSLRGVEYRWGI